MSIVICLIWLHVWPFLQLRLLAHRLVLVVLRRCLFLVQCLVRQIYLQIVLGLGLLVDRPSEH
jgi:hypothetical protein